MKHVPKAEVIIERYRDGWRTRPGTDYQALREFLADTRASNIRDHEGTVTFEGYYAPWSKEARKRQKRIEKMPLGLWGKLAGLTEAEEDGALAVQLREVSFQGSPEVLREVAMFLIETAARLEQNEHFDHEHWRTLVREGGEAGQFADVIVLEDQETA